jgi:predicted DNA-binding helix-hairpin-helix protein
LAIDTERKLELLGDAARFDAGEDGLAGQVRSRAGSVDLGRCISLAQRSGGRPVRLLKVLQTSVCENNCRYCAFRRDRDVRRAAFRPAELACAFMDLYRARQVEGLFLSSGLAYNAAATMDQMIATVEILRRRHGFRGYVHLKILPSSERAALERAIALATRVSINFEAPSPERLAALSAEKSFVDLETHLRWASELRQASPVAPGGLTTQYVVGAAGESDSELLSTSFRLYRDLGLARAYYSGFGPVRDTPLEGHPATSARRQLRLYQADFLLRDYGFSPNELAVDGAGNLPAAVDPKAAWARAHPEVFPVEVNRADRAALLRVPGIGPKGVGALLAARRRGTIRDLESLRALGIAAGRAAPFVLLGGRLLVEGWQLPLLDAEMAESADSANASVGQ